MTHLELALKAWRECSRLRERRRRCKDYTFGRQWGDITTDPKGNRLTEGELAERGGMKPLTNNLIRQLVKCVVGNYRASLESSDPAAARCPVSESVSARNSLPELDCRMLEEFLISGCAVQRVVTECRIAGTGVWIDNVSPENFFINRFTDPRGLDIELVGMLHSMSLRELLMRFAPAGGTRAVELTRRYSEENMRESGMPIGDAVSRYFFNAETGRCRVIELWTLESRSVLRCHDPETGEYFHVPEPDREELLQENRTRAKAKRTEIEFRAVTTLRWHCRFLTPDGDVLDEYDSPYAHGSHPFAVKFYPLIDGEVHSLVEDIIDQQRFVNRLITLVDHIMGVSAKGTLLVPVESLPTGWTEKEVGRLWAQSNSVIPYHYGKGEPRQVIANGDNAGAYQLLNLQMELFQQISGVSGALQGHAANGSVSAALFDSQVQRSATAILDMISSFHSFREMRNHLIASA